MTWEDGSLPCVWLVCDRMGRPCFPGVRLVHGRRGGVFYVFTIFFGRGRCLYRELGEWTVTGGSLGRLGLILIRLGGATG